jgi:thiamine biosynthesis lipoprotein
MIALITLSAPLLSGAESARVTFEHEAMGTSFVITLVPEGEEVFEEELRFLADEAFSAIDSLENRISNWRETSETSRLNRAAAQAPFEVSGALFQLLEESRLVYDWTAGAFDVTVDPYVKLWGFYAKEGHLPTAEELEEARARVGLEKVDIDAENQTVFFRTPGMGLDFGGIGKGLALDYAANVLRANGVTSAVVHSGTSSIVAIGAPPGEPGWTVRVRNPYDEQGEHIAEVQLSNESLATSSATENFLELDGKVYGHIFDPRTGWPVSGVLSATVIGPGGMRTDALSTAFFVLGEAKVREFCAAHSEYRAVLVIRDQEKEVPRVVHLGHASQSLAGEEPASEATASEKEQ